MKLPTSTKVCTKCGEERGLSDFYSQTNVSDGLMSACKDCHKLISRLRYRRRREDGGFRMYGKRDTPGKFYFPQMVKGAKRRSILVTLGLDEVEVLVVQPCHYCGSTDYRDSVGRSVNPWFNGLDRIDNDRGYEPGNVVPCCGECNMMRRNMTQDGFLHRCREIVKHQLGAG